MAIRDYLVSRLQVLNTRDDELICVCPSCKTTEQKFYFNCARGVGHCFKGKCNWSGDFIALIQLVENADWKSAVVEARKWRTAPKNDAFEDRMGYKGGKQSFASAGFPEEYSCTFTGAVGTIAYKYLLKRGLEPTTIRALKIGYCGFGLYQGRIVIPTFNDVGDCIFFVARKFIACPGPKVLNSPEVGGYAGKAECLFNLDKTELGEDLVLYEGAFDAAIQWQRLQAWRALAVFGTTVSDIQCLLLRMRKPKSITLFLDAEVPESKLVAQASKLKATVDTQVRYVTWSPSEITNETDPDQVTTHRMKELLENATVLTFGSAVRSRLTKGARVCLR